MIQGGGGTRFLLEPLNGVTVPRQLFGQELQGDQAAELDILRLVHYTHPAATELFQNAVMRDGLANHEARRPLGRHPRPRYLLKSTHAGRLAHPRMPNSVRAKRISPGPTEPQCI